MAEDYPTSPSKRRRTESPPTTTTAVPPSIPGLGISKPNPVEDVPMQEHLQAEQNDMPTSVFSNASATQAEVETGPDLLNMLMEQVEAQSRNKTDTDARKEPSAQPVSEPSEPAAVPGMPNSFENQTATLKTSADTTLSAHAEPSSVIEAEQVSVLASVEDSMKSQDVSNGEQNLTVPDIGHQASHESEMKMEQDDDDTATQGEASRSIASDVNSSSVIGIIPPSVEVKGEKEWETDSSPYSSSTDSSDDSSDHDDNDYAMLSPSEQARMLMDDVGSDDEGKSKGAGDAIKSVHEKTEEIVPKPDIVVTPEMRVEVLGAVEAVVEHTVLIKGKTTGEYQVLETNSLLCLQDRTVVGVVADTMGRVEQPLYVVRFTNDDAVREAGLSEKGTTVCYVHEHSTFVFTQPLKGIKGSDASNFHDEEVNDDELEFSDDEQEAEHKRLMKLKRRGVDVDSLPSRGMRGGRGGRRGTRGRGRDRGDYQPSLSTYSEHTLQPSDTTSLNYDDSEVGEYEPLRRPGMMESQQVSHPPGRQDGNSTSVHGAGPEGFQSHDHRRGGSYRGRSQTQRGRGGRGNLQQNRNQQQSQYQQSGYRQQPQQTYGFNQQQQNWMPPMPLPGMPNFFNPAMTGNMGFNFNQQFQQTTSYDQGQNANFGQQSGYAPSFRQEQPYDGARANNQAATQQVQQQLEELRRQSQQYGSRQQGGPNYG